MVHGQTQFAVMLPQASVCLHLRERQLKLNLHQINPYSPWQSFLKVSLGGNLMTVVKSVTCPVCGSLCDDIELTIENNEIVKVKYGCAMSESKFLGYKCEHRIKTPLIRKNNELVP